MTLQLAHVPAKTPVAPGDACAAAGVEAAKRAANVKDSIAATNLERTDSGLGKRTAIHEQHIALRTMLRKRRELIIDVLFATMVRAHTIRIWKHC
jgi:hypothetical protein